MQTIAGDFSVPVCGGRSFVYQEFMLGSIVEPAQGPYQLFSFRQDGEHRPFYATTHSAGFDLRARCGHTLQPGRWHAIETGLHIIEHAENLIVQTSLGPVHALPELQLRPRSGLALRHGITVLNAPSTIDADYRGEIKVILINLGPTPFVIQEGDRIAQAVCAMVFQMSSFDISAQKRGNNGFGSSGV